MYSLFTIRTRNERKATTILRCGTELSAARPYAHLLLDYLSQPLMHHHNPGQQLPACDASAFTAKRNLKLALRNSL